MTRVVPVLVVASIDLVARDSFVSGLLLDLPRAAAVSHDFDPAAEGGGLRRVVLDRDGVRYDDRRQLDHACLSCAVREDLVPSIAQLAGDGRWHQLVVALPVSADPQTVVALLHHEIAQARCGPVALAGVVTLVDPATLTDDLFGDDLLADRGLALGDVDRRAVGEALARQIECADLVATTAEASGLPATLLQHLTGPSVAAVGWNHLDGGELMAGRLDRDSFERRTNPLQLRRPVARTDGEVWTLDLASARPFHPDRLLERIEDLGRGAFRARGHFWLPTRPDALCVWDGSGGQLSIGRAGSWGRSRPSTRLVVTGLDPADRTRVATTFRDVLLTQAEAVAATSWVGQQDGFEPWLDDRAAVRNRREELS